MLIRLFPPPKPQRLSSVIKVHISQFLTTLSTTCDRSSTLSGMLHLQASDSEEQIATSAALAAPTRQKRKVKVSFAVFRFLAGSTLGVSTTSLITVCSDLVLPSHGWLQTPRREEEPGVGVAVFQEIKASQIHQHACLTRNFHGCCRAPLLPRVTPTRALCSTLPRSRMPFMNPSIRISCRRNLANSPRCWS